MRDTSSPSSVASSAAPAQDEKPVTIWAAICPFRRTGSPVVGNMGASLRHVIIIENAEWQKLCARVPELETMQFNVGTIQ